jgi:hypothetical protein
MARILARFGQIDRRAQIACSLLRCRRTEALIGSAQMTNDTPFWRTAGRKEVHTDQKKVTLT